MKNKIQLGTVSHATMRPEDLIPAFVQEIKYYNPRNKIVCEIGKRITKKSYDYNSEDAVYDLESLFDELNNICNIPYVYFGSHPGDGSDYGFWLSEYFESDFEGLKVNDLAEIPSNYTGEILLINDHGNMTLYNKGLNHRLYEIWAV